MPKHQFVWAKRVKQSPAFDEVERNPREARVKLAKDPLLKPVEHLYESEKSSEKPVVEIIEKPKVREEKPLAKTVEKPKIIEKPKEEKKHRRLLPKIRHTKKPEVKEEVQPEKPVINVKREYLKTGVEGFDDLMETGVPTGTSTLLAGGAGSGKTLFGLQILRNAAKNGRKALFMSFEESERRLVEHMEDFGWDADALIKSGMLMIKQFTTTEISRALEAMMAKTEGELLIDVKPVILPNHFKPDVVVLDSLTAIASAFKNEKAYRSYIENLLRYFEDLGVTAFLITETEQVPTVFSPTGVEEFLADGVIVLYNVRKGDIRESAIEILKMRGVKHTKKIVAMQITNSGIEVYPDQEVFGGIR